jgi:hypothetical protein
LWYFFVSASYCSSQNAQGISHRRRVIHPNLSFGLSALFTSCNWYSDEVPLPLLSAQASGAGFLFQVVCGPVMTHFGFPEFRFSELKLIDVAMRCQMSHSDIAPRHIVF